MAAWNAPPPTYDTHYTTTTLTPYLQLPHLLSLTWLAYPILSLLFIAFRLQASLDSSQDAVASAKDNLLASCKAAETAATSAASMPRYLAIASNEQFADAVNASLGAARAALILALTVMEAIINFIIDLYRSTLLCFLELVVRGGLALLIGAVEEINSVLTSAANALRSSIQNDITSANSAIQTAINAINKVNPFSDITAPQISVPSLDGLQNVTLPSSIQDALTKLNSSIPSVAELKDAVEDIIDTPFELVKKDINDTFSAFSFNSSVLPVPEQNRLSFCNDMDTSVVDDLGRDLIKTAKIGVIILILLALLLIGLNCLFTWYKWRCMKSHLEYTRQAWMTDPTMVHSIKSSGSVPHMTLSDHNLLTLQANSDHPLITRILNQFSARFYLSPSQHANIQWFFNYIFHAPALACLLIGIVGLLCVEIQLAAMHPLIAKYQDRAASATADFSNTIATSINQSMYNQSASYANDVNGRVDAIQSSINDGLFGWVNGTTTSLNTTINNFYNDIENAVTTVFGGTILESPANEFIKCFIGSKVDAIESALTFLHDNLKVDIPRVNDTVLVLSPATVNEATQPIAAAAIGGGEGNNDGGLIMRLVNSYADSLRKERITFIIFICLWGIVVLMGIAVLFWHSYGKTLVEKHKRKKWETEQRSGIDGLVVPFREGMVGNEKGVAGDSAHNLPSFTPLPSPRPRFFPARAASPSGNFRDTEYATEPSWDNHFGKKPDQEETRSVSGSKKFMAIGRKVLGRNKSTVEKEPSLKETSSVKQQQLQSHQDDARNSVWFDRVMSMIGVKKESDVDSIDLANNQAGRGRPHLRIEVNPPSTDFSRSGDENYASGGGIPNSRWSSSPVASEAPKPWINMVSPTMKKHSTPPRPPVPLPASKVRRPAVPSDVGPSPFDDPFTSSSLAGASAVPIPLYHGFNTTKGPSHTRSGSSPLSPFVNPSRTSQIPQPQQLNVPHDRHRRTSSVPSPTWQREADNASVNPMTRMLTVNGHESALNPFVTPFDDEHRVTIQHNAVNARKSIPTNPFIAI